MKEEEMQMKGWKTRIPKTHHIHDLHQAERENDRERLRVIGNGPLHTVIVLQQVFQQSPLVENKAATHVLGLPKRPDPQSARPSEVQHRATTFHTESWKIHPSSKPLILLGHEGCWGLFQHSEGRGQETPWKGLQSITGQTRRQKSPPRLKAGSGAVPCTHSTSKQVYQQHSN
ncbi:hypothetical protein AOLI_G00315470 [Acnodon oligacanthus]